MSASPARFTFDLDLGRRQEQGGITPDNSFAILEQSARQSGYDEGLAAGEQGATARAARDLADAAADLGNRVAAMAADLDRTQGGLKAEAVQLARLIAEKLATTLLAREPTAEIEALIVECLASLDSAPHLVIRCNPDLADAVRDIAMSRIEASGFAGRLVVMGEAGIGMGDGRLEWVDGGLVRDRATIASDIDARIAAYLAARNIHNGAAGAGENT